MHHELIRYGVTGLLGTSVHYGAMYLLIDAGSSPELATLAGAVTGLIVNFQLCRQWVFTRHSSNSVFQAARFFFTASLMLANNTFLVWALNPTVGVWISQLIATVCGFLLGYLINRHWTFLSTADQSL